MKSFEFNKLIIIESLCADEPHTGTELYNDVKFNEYRYSNLSVELKTSSITFLIKALSTT